MRFPLMLRRTHVAKMAEANETVNCFYVAARETQTENRALRAEIADRARSEADAREQLRAIKAARSAATAKGNRARAAKCRAAQ